MPTSVILSDVVGISNGLTHCIDMCGLDDDTSGSIEEKIRPKARRQRSYSEGHTPKRKNTPPWGYPRRDLLWTDDIEEKIKEWYRGCKSSAVSHNLKAKEHRKIFYGLNIPAAIIPMTIATVGDMDNDIVTIVLLVIMGILTIINGFLNPGKLTEMHLNFEAMYNELAVEISSDLIKPKIYRQSADVFLQRIMDRYNSLNNRAPSI